MRWPDWRMSPQTKYGFFGVTEVFLNPHALPVNCHYLVRQCGSAT